MIESGTLTVLHRARASLATGPFDFHDWERCTCGHLHLAATGSWAPRRGDVRSPRPGTPYAEAVLAIARLLVPGDRRLRAQRPWYDRRSREALAVRAISDATLRRGLAERDRVRRADALAVIDAAIGALQLADVHERPLPA
jgi:hypothetical protein